MLRSQVALVHIGKLSLAKSITYADSASSSAQGNALLIKDVERLAELVHEATGE
jgi:hypothetical protein